MARDQQPVVHPLSGPDELELYYRINCAAFGVTFDRAAFDSRRPTLDIGRSLLATLDGAPCGGAASLRTELTLPGGAAVATAAVTDVGVLPTHRRRGVVSALMAHQLRDCRDRGDVLAVLHASEAGIYERFGYGVATRWRLVELDARRAAFRSDWPDPGGSLRHVRRDAADTLVACAGVHDRARLAHPGGLARSEAWWRVVLGDAATYQGGGSDRQVILHLDDAGDPDGYVIYQVTQDWSAGQAEHSIEVWELVGAGHHGPQVELALWRAMLDHDLVAKVDGPIAIDHALFDVVADPRQARTRWDQDLLWVRLLDVRGAFEARAYGSDGSFSFDLVDRHLPEQAGTHRLSVSDGVARCERTDDEPDLVLDVSELGTVLLGGGSLRRAVRAGRVGERTPGAAAGADALLAVWPMPWCWVRF